MAALFDSGVTAGGKPESADCYYLIYGSYSGNWLDALTDVDRLGKRRGPATEPVWRNSAATHFFMLHGFAWSSEVYCTSAWSLRTVDQLRTVTESLRTLLSAVARGLARIPSGHHM